MAMPPAKNNFDGPAFLANLESMDFLLSGSATLHGICDCVDSPKAVQATSC